MAGKKRIVSLVLAIMSVPLLVAVGVAVAFHLHNRNNGSLVSSGEKREYLLYVPESYDPNRPAPLVISLHGGGGWPAMQRDLSGWNRLADRHGFVVVYPSGLLEPGIRGWRVLNRGPGLAKDVQFMVDLVDEVASTHAIDRSRIYVNGMSNGGGMTFVLSCELSDRIAAVGLVASAQMLPWSWCTDTRAVPMVAFHGTADPVVPYEGGATWVWHGSFPDMSQWTAQWARRNGCRPEARRSQEGNVIREEFTDCAEGASVTLYTLEGGGHTWPGGTPLPEWFVGATSDAIDATAVMWDFFQQHRLALN